MEKIVKLVIIAVILLVVILLLVPIMLNMGIVNPSSGNVYTGLDGFGNVKPMEWTCSSLSGELKMIMVNAAGQEISNLAVANENCNPTVVEAGDSSICTITQAPGCAGIAAGNGFESDVVVSYTTTTGSEKQSIGSLWGPVE